MPAFVSGAAKAHADERAADAQAAADAKAAADGSADGCFCGVNFGCVINAPARSVDVLLHHKPHAPRESARLFREWQL